MIFSDVFLGAISREFGQGKGDCISWVIKLNVIFFPVTLGVNLKYGSCLRVHQSFEVPKESLELAEGICSRLSVIVDMFLAVNEPIKAVGTRAGNCRRFSTARYDIGLKLYLYD